MAKIEQLKKDYPQYIFVSDIHGTKKTIDLLKKAIADWPQAHVVTGGDYVDGRKDSKFVLDYLMQLSEEKKATVIRGNHEQMLLRFAEGKDQPITYMDSLWLVNGGKTTLSSLFGYDYINYHNEDEVKKVEQQLLDSKYYQFINSLPLMVETPHYLFAHGGILPNKNFNNPDVYPLLNNGDTGLPKFDFYVLWARQEYWYEKALPNNIFAHNKTGHTIVTGHTPTALISGQYPAEYHLKAMKELPFTQCHIRIVQYPEEPARIFADGGCHHGSSHNWGNVLVLDAEDQPLAVYDYQHQTGIEWQKYRANFKNE